MKNTLPKILFAALLVALASSGSYAKGLEDNYSDKTSIGHWFYDDPAKMQEPEPTPQPPPENTIVNPSPEPEKQVKPKEPVKLTVEWIQDNLEKYMHRAIDDPSPENVRAYLYLQRVMLDKSENFAQATQAALLTDPLLDENTRRPTASFGVEQRNRDSEQVMKDLITKISKRAGLWFFYRQDEMSMNYKQAGVLEALERTTGVVVQAISMDGSALPEGKYPNFKLDQGHSKTLKIIQTPALFLVRPDTNQISPLGQSLLALPEVKKRVMLAAATAGWIDEKDFERAKGMGGEMTMQSTPVVSAEIAQDPEQMANTLMRILEEKQDEL